MGTVVYIDFRAPRGVSPAERAYQLYSEASAIDEDPPKWAEAERLYRCALAIQPRMACARVNLGNMLFKTRRTSEAHLEYEQALVDDPGCAEAHYNLGYLFMERGQPRQALVCFLQAIKLDCEHADAYFMCGMALESDGDPHTARWHWKKYLELEPQGTHATIARAHLAQAAGGPYVRDHRTPKTRHAKRTSDGER
jgi:tetratricopeptide (TPR) repeat protein